jgi:ParB-like chromosome segregation protein Spo0J
MKLLKSKHNDFPHFYHEVPLAMLDTKSPVQNVAFVLLKKYIATEGLHWPIVVFPGRKVQVGHQRVEIAKQFGYDTISAYMPNNSDFGNRLQWRK